MQYVVGRETRNCTILYVAWWGSAKLCLDWPTWISIAGMCTEMTEYVKTAIWIWQNKHSIIANYKWHLHWASYTKVFGTHTRRCSISSLVLNKSARLPNKYWNDIFKRMVWSGSWHLRFLLCRHTVKTNIICILGVCILMGKGITMNQTSRASPAAHHKHTAWEGNQRTQACHQSKWHRKAFTFKTHLCRQT